MKTNTIQSMLRRLAPLSVLLLNPSLWAAPIPIAAGNTVYAQNFDTLPTVTNNNTATPPWADDSTIPGWYVYRAGTNTTPIGFGGAAYAYYVVDGNAPPNTAPLAHALYSAGVNGSTERALGSSSTTAQGELSGIVLFQNTTTHPVVVTNIKYDLEVYRTNTGANNRETMFVWYRTAATAAAALTITTGGVTATIFPATVSTGPTTGSGYITGWNRLTQFETPYSNASAGVPVSVTVPFSAAPASSVTVPAGQFLAFRWSNINDGGTDAILGVDNVELSFSEQTAAITATVNSTTRQAGADPADPADDTFTASVTVSKDGTPSTEWTSTPSPADAGPYAYGTPYTFGPFPVTASPQVVDISAIGGPTLTAQVTLTSPPTPAVVGTNSLPGDPVIRISSGIAPWTQMAGLPADRRIQLNNGNGLAGINTDAIALTPGTPKCVILSLDYNDNSTGSNAETGDSVKVELVTDAGTINLTSAYDADGTSPSNGAAINGEDDALLTSSDELNPDSLPEPYTFTAHWLLAGVIPAAATTVQVRISANNDSGSETLRIGNIQLRPCIDTDEDGVLDVFEEVQGTDANDETSFFHIVGQSSVPGSASITVTSSATRTYAFESSSDLLVWTRDALPGTPPGLPFLANDPGTGGNITLTRANANPARLFWRAKVHLPTTDIVSP